MSDQDRQTGTTDETHESHETEQPDQGGTHTVRPRWTWIALPVMIAGLVVIGVGDAQSSTVLIVIGIVVLAVGAAAALYGGFFYNVQGGASASGQIKDVVEGNEHEFPGPDSKRSEPEVKRDVRRRWLRDR
jgi:hypothetical protein